VVLVILNIRHYSKIGDCVCLDERQVVK